MKKANLLKTVSLVAITAIASLGGAVDSVMAQSQDGSNLYNTIEKSDQSNVRNPYAEEFSYTLGEVVTDTSDVERVYLSMIDQIKSSELGAQLIASLDTTDLLIHANPNIGKGQLRDSNTPMAKAIKEVLRDMGEDVDKASADGTVAAYESKIYKIANQEQGHRITTNVWSMDYSVDDLRTMLEELAHAAQFGVNGIGEGDQEYTSDEYAAASLMREVAAKHYVLKVLEDINPDYIDQLEQYDEEVKLYKDTKGDLGAFALGMSGDTPFMRGYYSIAYKNAENVKSMIASNIVDVVDDGASFEDHMNKSVLGDGTLSTDIIDKFQQNMVDYQSIYQKQLEERAEFSEEFNRRVSAKLDSLRSQ